MKIYAPSWYKDFRCVGGSCTSNCCIGWEIDVDAEAYEKYKRLDEALHTDICASIFLDGDGAHFKTCEGGKCPHLNRDNLCEIIINHGEDMLTHICREHPRYYSRLLSRTEVGIGLSCPTAARLVICSPLPTVSLYRDDGDGRSDAEMSADEKKQARAEGIAIAFRDSVSDMLPELTPYGLCIYVDRLARETVDDLLLDTQIGFIPEEQCFEASFYTSKRLKMRKYNKERQREGLVGLFSQLEMLDAAFGNELMRAVEGINADDGGFKEFTVSCGGAYFKRLLFYFLHRYLLDGAVDGTLPERARLSVIYAFAVTYLGYLRGGEESDVIGAAVDFSRNVEYSDKNLDTAIDFLSLDDGVGVELLCDALR